MIFSTTEGNPDWRIQMGCSLTQLTMTTLIATDLARMYSTVFDVSQRRPDILAMEIMERCFSKILLKGRKSFG